MLQAGVNSYVVACLNALACGVQFQKCQLHFQVACDSISKVLVTFPPRVRNGPNWPGRAVLGHRPFPPRLRPPPPPSVGRTLGERRLTDARRPKRIQGSATCTR